MLLEHHATKLQNRIAKEPDPLRDSPGGRGTRGGIGYIRLVERASWINLVAVEGSKVIQSTLMDQSLP